MKLKENTKYDLITISSMGVRITPINSQPVHTSNLFQMESTSAETNVLNISASLGLQTLVLTKFVQNSPIAKFIQGELRKRNINYMGKEVLQDSPWGSRHQMNIADSGYGARGPRVYNDRAGEVGRAISAEDFDLEEIFVKGGCKILHLSGLVVALSEDTTKCCLEIAKKAKENGTMISFDINYRESFWKNREEELRESFQKIARISDILIGNEEDFQLGLGLKGPRGDQDIFKNERSFKKMIMNAKKEYPKVKIFATTLRKVVNANQHMWGAMMKTEKGWIYEKPREIQVYDRIGGGDGFVGGLLYGILKNWNEKKAIKFAWATGALATTLETDYATPIDEKQIWSIYQGNARVSR